MHAHTPKTRSRRETQPALVQPLNLGHGVPLMTHLLPKSQTFFFLSTPFHCAISRRTETQRLLPGVGVGAPRGRSHLEPPQHGSRSRALVLAL